MSRSTSTEPLWSARWLRVVTAFVVVLLTLAFFAAPTVHAQPSHPQPLLHFGLDDGRNPTVGSGTLGPLYYLRLSGEVRFVSWPPGLALEFVEGRACTEADPARLDVVESDFSIFVRFRPTASGGGQSEGLLIDSGSSGGYRLIYDSRSGRVTARLDGNTDVVAESTTRVDDGNAHEVLMRRRGQVLELFVDGAMAASAPIPADFASPGIPSAFCVGGSGRQREQFRGVVDEVRLYDVAVSPEDLAPSADCNSNGIADDVEIALGLTPDVNRDGVPDDCQSWRDLGYGIRRIIALGDSLTDTWRSKATYGIPSDEQGWEGRYSNGPVWIEYLSKFLGLEYVPITNYAHTGAGTGRGENSVFPGGPGLLDQVDSIREWIAEGNSIEPDDLIVVWIGPNDFEDAGSLDNLINRQIANLTEAFRSLIELGAKRILVANLPNLAATPRVKELEDPVASGLAELGTVAYNANLAWAMALLESRTPWVDVIFVDVFSLFEAIVANPLEFGFTDASTPCRSDDSPTVCDNPDLHVFWDDLHPTTAAHRRLALNAQQALVSGGMPLPPIGLLDCGDLRCPFVTITSPQDGAFFTDDSIQVVGRVRGTLLPGLVLRVHGQEVAIAADGSFSALVDFAPGRLETPIVAELADANGRVLSRDRKMTFHGTAVDADDVVSRAVEILLRRGGIDAVRDEILYALMSSRVLDIRQALFDRNPLVFDDSGSIGYEITVLGAGYNCPTIDIIPKNGRLLVQVTLHDVRVDYYAKLWSPEWWDPGLDCTGTITARNAWVKAEFQLIPRRGGPDGEIEVNLVGDPLFDMVGFHHDFHCTKGDFVEFLADLFDFQVDPIIEAIVKTEVESKLFSEERGRKLESDIEAALASISMSRPVGEATGVNVEADITTIGIDNASDAVITAFEARFSSAEADFSRTVSIPAQSLTYPDVDPVSGEPYAGAVSFKLSSLNQLLLALSNNLLSPIELESWNLGAGDTVITAGQLALIIPSFRIAPPNKRFVIRIRPTQPVMLVEEDAPERTLPDVLLPQIILEIAPYSRTGSQKAVLSAAIDVRLCLNATFDPRTSSLGLELAPSCEPHAIVILRNKVQADEASLALMARSVMDSLVGGLLGTGFSYPLPGIAGVDLSVNAITKANGYFSMYFDAASDNGRPDLVIRNIRVPAEVDRNTGFRITFDVVNIGSSAADRVVFVGAGLSLNPIPMDGNDIPLGSLRLDFGIDPLEPGESRTFWIDTLPFPAAYRGRQYVILGIDVPEPPAFLPTSGNLCEGSEFNNVAFAQTMVSAPDAWIESFAPMTDPVSDRPTKYRVTVGRNSIGPESLDVPVVLCYLGTGICTPVNWVRLSPGQTKTIDVWIDSPHYDDGRSSTCGASAQFPIRACANLSDDGNEANDCSDIQVRVTEQYWDLRLELVGAPETGGRGEEISWRVRISQVGNVPSPVDRVLRTGIDAFRGDSQWWHLIMDACGRFVPFNYPIGVLEPGESVLTPSFRLCIRQDAFVQEQYLKVGLAGPDNCLDGNYAEAPIQITH